MDHWPFTSSKRNGRNWSDNNYNDDDEFADDILDDDDKDDDSSNDGGLLEGYYPSSFSGAMEASPSSESSSLPTFLSTLMKMSSRLSRIVYRKLRPKTYGGVATLGVLFALCLPFLLEISGSRSYNRGKGLYGMTHLPRALVDSLLDAASTTIPGVGHIKLRMRSSSGNTGASGSGSDEDLEGTRPDFVYEHPYVSSSYYTSTKSLKTLVAIEDVQVLKSLIRQQEQQEQGADSLREIKTRLAIVRPFCEFDAEALPTTFTCWNALPPCKAAQDDIDDYEDDYYEQYMTEYQVGSDGELVGTQNVTKGSASARNLYKLLGDKFFDLVGSDAMKSATADVFLFYSQTFLENEVAIKAVDTIIDQFFEPGGWSQCFDNIYAIEANIPQELDLYIPSAQEELYNWVNGPNRQYEAAFRIIQSGESTMVFIWWRVTPCRLRLIGWM